MSRSRIMHSVINQVIEDMARGNIPSPLPSQSGLAEMYNISRTTVLLHTPAFKRMWRAHPGGEKLCYRPQTRTERWI